MSGGSSGITPVPPYLPQCSGLTQQEFSSEYPSRGVAFNLTNAGEYAWQVGVVP
jgi:hypothetical protein